MMPSQPRAAVSRRQFLTTTAGLVGAMMASSHYPAGAAESDGDSLRVIAYNVYECTGWPKDNALAKKATAAGQMPGRFARALAGYQADIITFSESPREEVVRQIAQQLSMNYVRFPSAGNWPGTLLSRFEITEAKNVPLVDGQRPNDLFTRHWGQATVKLPDGDPLIVHSAHLHPSDQAVRLREIEAMLASTKDDLRANRSMLLMGDLNHTPTPPEYPLWTEAGWVDTFAQVGEGKGFTIKADKPERRIDYVMAAGPLAKHVIESRPLFEGAFRTKPADSEAFALSDHLPQLAVFQAGQ